MYNIIEDMEEYDWRSDFLIFDQEEEIAFLDTAASAQKPRQVLFAMNEAMQNHYANIHRGLYKYSQATTSAYEAVRGKVAQFINAQHEDEIVFTRNTTEAINLVAQSWGKMNLGIGDEVLLTEMEHHANIVPWQLLQKEYGFTIKTIPVLDNATLDYAALEELLNDNTKLVSFVATSNATGVENNINRIVETVRDEACNAKILIDGSQSIVHGKTDIDIMDCDFFVFTGHKLYGPTGIGVLWGREEILADMPPFLGGGDMIERVSFDKGTTFKEAPARFEAGTPAIIETIGLGTAIDYVSKIGMDTIKDHETKLYEYALPQLKDIEGLKIYGDVEHKAPVFSFSLEGVHSSDLGTILDQMNVAVRTGHHCCMPLMQRYGIEGTTRASIGLYNTKKDIDMLVAGIEKTKRMFA